MTNVLGMQRKQKGRGATEMEDRLKHPVFIIFLEEQT
jgi:hypothetical protein